MTTALTVVSLGLVARGHVAFADLDEPLAAVLHSVIYKDASPDSLGLPRVVLVFQPGDCTGLRATVDRLNRLHAEQGTSKRFVGGLLVNAPKSKLVTDSVITSLGADFPVYVNHGFHPVAARLVGLGHRDTPVVLGIDSDGTVLFAAQALSSRVAPLLDLSPLLQPASS